MKLTQLNNAIYYLDNFVKYRVQRLFFKPYLSDSMIKLEMNVLLKHMFVIQVKILLTLRVIC